MSRAGPRYVYGLVRADGPALPDVAGVAGGRLDTVEHGPVAAVVSDVPDGDVRARRADLLAHSDVLQALIAERDVVPVRFGSVYTSPAQVQRELLERHGRALRRLLDDLSGLVEVQVKAGYDEAAIAAVLVGSDRKLARMQAGVAGGRNGYGARIELGRRFAELLERRRRADAHALATALEGAAVALRAGDPPGEYGVVNLSLLVRRDGLARFDRETEALAGSVGDLMTLSVMGPLPPYSFVDGTLAEVG